MNVDPRAKIAGWALAALLLSAAVGAWLGPSAPPDDEVPTPAASALGDVLGRVESLAAEVSELQTALDDERSQRAALQLELALLRREFAGGASTGPSDATARELDPSADASDEDAAKEPDPPPPDEAAAAQAPGWFDTESLLRVGFDERHVEWLREVFAELQMQELYLKDRATRGGWLRKPRYQKGLQSLSNQWRQTLGEEDYALMLYAAGRNNRVLVRGVVANSPAARAGMETGDLILRYGDAPVSTPSELIRATSKGERGSGVTVDVLRDGAEQRLYLERGPLGVQIVSVRRAPVAQP